MSGEKPRPNTVYVLTGVDARGRRFRIATGNRFWAECHNLYRGTLWEVRGKRRRAIRRWFN